jgi:hypothetical protein
MANIQQNAVLTGKLDDVDALFRWPEWHACFRPLCPECVAEIMETKTWHFACGHQFPPGFHPRDHRHGHVPFLFRLLRPVPRLPQVHRQKIMMGFRCTRHLGPIEEFAQTPLCKRHEARFTFLAVFFAISRRIRILVSAIRMSCNCRFLIFQLRHLVPAATAAQYMANSQYSFCLAVSIIFMSCSFVAILPIRSLDCFSALYRSATSPFQQFPCTITPRRSRSS